MAFAFNQLPFEGGGCRHHCAKQDLGRRPGATNRQLTPACLLTILFKEVLYTNICSL
jgi:hypothetical protein